VRLGDGEQLGDDGEHAVEVAGARAALEQAADRTGGDAGLHGPGRVHLVDRGGEHRVDAEPGEGGAVGLEVAGVAVEILVGAKLLWVDEDRHDDAVGPPPGFVHQRHVPVVKRAHGRHKRHRLAGLAECAQRFRKLCLAIDGLHLFTCTVIEIGTPPLAM